MRQLWLIGGSVLLLASLSLAQEKLESQWKCGKASDDHSIDVGDKANHAYAVSKTTCTATKSEIGGTKEKEGIGTQFNEATGNATTWHGVFVVTTESGDKIHYHYTGKGMMKDGKFTSGTNKWTMMGGTGKFAKAKGEGTCAGKGDGADGATWGCTGTYTMK
jgi:hypothetical protein